MKRIVIVVVVLVAALVLAGCAAGPNALVGSADGEDTSSRRKSLKQNE